MLLVISRRVAAGVAGVVGVAGRVPVAAVAVTVAAVSATALSAVAAAPALAAAHTAAHTGVSAPPPVRPEDRAAAPADHLTVTVRHAGGGRDGRYQLSCHPGAGSHPDVSGACRTLDRNSRWGRDTFAPVAPGQMCTMLYGGPATAHVTGIWAGRPVDATYDRSNGCEVERWDRLVPLLPDLRDPHDLRA
ncbi:SSI family serine proteinase inhibitor [Streptomyces sp. NPDC001480]|uniref:SSI family serine proteinase inhibitor n=1 Tax=Streptomyces sp. NPDC001480 TaxID=3364577 RepID=UPI0036CF70E0